MEMIINNIILMIDNIHKEIQIDIQIINKI